MFKSNYKNYRFSTSGRMQIATKRFDNVRSKYGKQIKPDAFAF